MTHLTPHNQQTILRACAVYFVACGLSATYIPSSWLWASGLPTQVSPELSITFGVIGAFMLALAAGAVIASARPAGNTGLILTLAIANALDCVSTVKAVLSGSLPYINGLLFVAVAGAWTAALLLTWRSARR